MDIREGQICEFLEGGRFMVAACLGKKGARYHLITHLGRETNLSKNRIVHASPDTIRSANRTEIINKLREIDAKRRRIQEEIDITEIWELLEEEASVWTPREFASIIFGDASTPDHEAASIRAVIMEHTHFKFRDHLIKAQSRETVEKMLEQKRLEEERMKRLEQGGRLITSIWKEEDITSLDLSDPGQLHWIEAMKDFCIHGEESDYSNEVKDLFKQAGMHWSTAPFETLVRANIWNEDENIELLRSGIERGFSESLMDEAERIAQVYEAELKKTGEREDLQGLHTFTIDAEESKDLDDAISVQETDDGLEIGIHITDVASFVRPGTGLFEEAVERATSIYLPDEIVPMLPEILSNETFSLLPGRPRACLSFFALLDQTGHIKEQRITPSIISSKEKISYTKADELIQEEGPIKSLYNMALRLKALRIKEGNALPLPIPELSIRVIDGEIHVKLDQPGPGRFLISELMILANAIAARFLRDMGLPALFRSQPEPRERIIDGTNTDLKVNYRQRRLISRGVLGPEPDFHSGLGLECYTTVTSPIRRALDLIMQAQILEKLLKDQQLFSQKELDNLSITIQQGLVRAASVRTARFRYWLLKHLTNLQGQDLRGWILDVLDSKVLVVLEDYLLTVELPKEHKMDYHLDQEVFVRIKKVNPRENLLKFEWGTRQ